jgi:hypothetical protein
VEIDEVKFAKTTNHPSVKVLKYMLLGGEVKLDGLKLRLAERVGGGYTPAIVGEAYNAQTQETRPYVLGSDEMPLSYFIKQCEKLTEDELYVISCNTILTEINRKDR